MLGMKILGTKIYAAFMGFVFALEMLFMNPAAAITSFASSGSTNATESELSQVTEPVVALIKNVTNVLIPLVGAVGAVYCILLGVKFAKAEEPQEREKAKAHLRNAIIGYVLIFVLVVALSRLTPVMLSWMNKNVK